MNALVVKEVDVVYHGVDHEQFFPGVGISGEERADTVWTHHATGIGDTPAEAYEDALSGLYDTGVWTSRAVEERDRLLKEHTHAKFCAGNHVTPVEVEAQWEEGGAQGTLHCYLTIYARCESVPVVVRLDNQGGDWERYGTVVVTTDQANAEDDQYIDGSTWEIPGDMREAYTILTDRPSLVDDLHAAGYELDLAEYDPPTAIDVARWEAVCEAENAGSTYDEIDALLEVIKEAACT